MKQGKLVRDKIPQIITDSGKKPMTRILDSEEYLRELDQKLNEEAAEYQADKSSKSNKLPGWNDFFVRFAKNQYVMYEMIHGVEGIRKRYEDCCRDNLHSIWANQELYREGNSETAFCMILEKNMRPVYDSARRQGYGVWERKGMQGRSVREGDGSAAPVRRL